MHHPATVAAACLGLAACVVHQGGGWTPEPSPSKHVDAVRIVAFGGVTNDRAGDRVAAKITETLRSSRVDGRPAVSLFLGNADGACNASVDGGSGRLAAAIDEHMGDGSAYAIDGVRGAGCDELGARPGDAFLVEVDAEGGTQVASVCDPERGCQLLPPSDDLRVRLVLLDTVGWTAPDQEKPRALRSAEHLLAAIEEQDDVLGSAVPLIAVVAMPIESPGVAGQGGREASASFRQHPPFLRSALQRGVLTGVIAGHERELVVDDDLSRAVKRSSRQWLSAPTFQIISGAAGDAPRIRTRRSGGVSSLPDLRSLRAGFVELRITEDQVEARVHEYAGRWRVASVEWPLHRPPHPAETESPPLTPCPRCDPEDGAADHARPAR